MARRPVFVAIDRYPYVGEVSPDFEWNGGFSISQSRKNIRALHEAYACRYQQARVLEISSKTEQLPEGKALSAFYLPILCREAGGSVTVECAFQAAKVFRNGGPYTDILGMGSREAKRDPRLKESGELVSFRFDGRDYPTEPRTAFYHWLYCTALRQSPELSARLLEYDAFTDIAFNPERSLNCQARSAALYVGLVRAGMADRLTDFDTFAEAVFRVQTTRAPEIAAAPAASAPVKRPEPAVPAARLEAGATVIHPRWGTGTVLSGGDTVTIRFEIGEKRLAAAWVQSNCRVESGSEA